MSFQHRPIDSPELTAALARIKANSANEPGPSDADRIAWMDGLPVGTLFESTSEKVSIEVYRTREGWEVKHYYHGASFMHRVSTWREVADLMMDPPTPFEPQPSKHGSWEENFLRRPEEM